MRAFDYIIVGAGSAGCVLANRLSADPSISVCLIEAGKKDNSLLVRMPGGVGQLLKQEGPYNWGFETVPQQYLGNRQLWQPRGRGWGGSSSINGMIYVRGHSSDYDQWAQMGLTGWTYDDVLPYFKKSEGHEAGGDAYHGGEGPLKVTEPPADTPIYRAFFEAGRQAGFPYTPDFNGAEQHGVGPFQRTISDAERCSAATAYLKPVLNRPNLTIMSTCRVTRIVLEHGRARGVETVLAKGQPVETINANREVLLCAGALQSPQILQLSGIGDPNHLKDHGIDVKVAAPGVGSNLQDHLDVVLVHEMREPLSLYSQTKGWRRPLVGVRYLLNKSGPGADNHLQVGGFLKTRAGLEAPDIQIHLVNAIMIDHGRAGFDRDGFTLHSCQLRPESRGTVSLMSNDPFAAPAIDPNYLATENDRTVMRDSVKLMRNVAQQEAFTPYRGPEMVPGADAASDDEIDAYIRETAETIYHPVGTVAMGAADTAPLDGELRVRGIQGLRVVDASVMPTLIGGNTNAPTIMIAEKAADMILDKRPAAPPEIELV
ncbi:MAG: choline dehydrogenase [Pseudomonadota bacterium]